MTTFYVFRPLALAIAIATGFAALAFLVACKPEVGQWGDPCKDRGATQANSDGSRYECRPDPENSARSRWYRVALPAPGEEVNDRGPYASL